MGRRGRRTAEMVRIAGERIHRLFSLARMSAVKGEHEFADRYIALAFRIGMRYNVRIPARYRTFYCRKCHAYLLPGRTSRTRINRGWVSITCLKCGHIYRHPYLREQRMKRGGKGNA